MIIAMAQQMSLPFTFGELRDRKAIEVVAVNLLKTVAQGSRACFTYLHLQVVQRQLPVHYDATRGLGRKEALELTTVVLCQGMPSDTKTVGFEERLNRLKWGHI